MTARSRIENHLLSALLSSGTPTAAQELGVRPEHFTYRQSEYRYLLDYYRTYGQPPSIAGMLDRFPGLDHDPERRDVPLYCEDLIAAVNKAELTQVIQSAAVSVNEGDLEAAEMALATYTKQQLAPPLTNLLETESFLDTYDSVEDALDWPWDTLNRVTSGMRRGELYYLAARLGQGKSWSLTQMVGNALLCGRDVMFYSLEMAAAQVLTRMHVYLGARLGFPDINHVAMRNKTFDLIAYRKLTRMIRDQVPGRLYVRDTSSGVISPATLLGGQNKEVDLIVVDHAGLMHTPGGDRAISDWRVMASISNQLKEVALGQNVRILAAAQINREGDRESRVWEPPKVKHLAQSDALGQDADTVITHRRVGRSTMVYSVEKTRDGDSEVAFYTKFEPNRGVFDEISRDQAQARYDDEQDDD